METDSLLQESNSERKFFHFSRLRRQKDVETKRKAKKRQWMAGITFEVVTSLEDTRNLVETSYWVWVVQLSAIQNAMVAFKPGSIEYWVLKSDEKMWRFYDPKQQVLEKVKKIVDRERQADHVIWKVGVSADDARGQG